jgi:hypothetical protein
MKNELKVVDGTSSGGRAPRPKRGLTRALYDTVEACGGADYATVRKYLPAAVENITQIISRKKIERGLYDAVYRGYLIHDSAHKMWRVAPASYYEVRQDYLTTLHSHPHEKRGERGPYETVIPRQPLTFGQVHLLISMVAGAFVVGFIFGQAFRFAGF